MPDRQSALHSVLKPGRFGKSDGEAGLIISLVQPDDIQQIALFEGGEKNVLAALKKLGLSTFDTRKALSAKTVTSLPIAPEKILLVSWDGLLSDSLAEVKTTDAVATDLSHARTILRLTGAKVTDILNRGMMIDLHDDSFPPGSATQSPIHDISILLHRHDSGEIYDLYLPRSFAEDLYGWLMTHGAPFGIEVKGEA